MACKPMDPLGFPRLTAAGVPIEGRHPASISKMEQMLAECAKHEVKTLTPPFSFGKKNEAKVRYKCPGCGDERESILAHVFAKTRINEFLLCMKCGHSRGKHGAGQYIADDLDFVSRQFPLAIASNIELTSFAKRTFPCIETFLEQCLKDGIQTCNPPAVRDIHGATLLRHHCPSCISTIEKKPSHFEKSKKYNCLSCLKTREPSAIKFKTPSKIGAPIPVGRATEIIERSSFPLLDAAKVELEKFRTSSLRHMEDVLSLLHSNNIKICTPAFTKAPVSGNSLINFNCPTCGSRARSQASTFLTKKYFGCKGCCASMINKTHKSKGVDLIKSQIETLGLHVINHDHKTQEDGKWTVRCDSGHIFTKSAAKLLNGIKHCPDCFTGSVEQELARALIESHFKAEFPTRHPDWLINPSTQRVLELDMYNEDLALAFEYHGPQHFLPIWGEERLALSQRNDEARRQGCIAQKVKLIEVQFADPQTSRELNFLEAIAEQLRATGIPIASDLPKSLLGKVKSNTDKTKEINQALHDILAKVNRVWVGGTYLNAKSIIQTKCIDWGHQAGARASVLLYNAGSKKCAKCSHSNRRRKTEARYSKEFEALCKEKCWIFLTLHLNSKKTIVGFKYKDDFGEHVAGRKMIHELRKQSGRAL